MVRDAPRPIRLDDYRPPEFLIDRVDLHFDLAPELTRVSARLELRRNLAAIPGDGDLILHGEQLVLERIALDGETLGPDRYRVDSGSLVLTQVPDRCCLETRVRIAPTGNSALEGLYQSGEILCTQCEAEGFRRITYFLDRPDVMARYGVTLVADQARFPVLLANGNPVETAVLGDGRHLARWEDPVPKPSYLFALVAGDLGLVEDRFTTASGREVGLRLYAEWPNLDQCAHAMAALKKAMRWDEERFGREYDLDLYMIVAVSRFNMGAMENKGLNIFNDRLVLARPETATDQDYLNIEGVIAHEYFHNWTGNRITCRDWFQLSLKEGLTVYRDQEFSADLGARAVRRIADVALLRSHQFAEDAGPLAHPVRPDSYIEINNFYTATVYQKGAELVRMQATLLGPEGFRRAMDLYFQRHDGQAVTTDDFLACMADASGLDLTQFRRWYTQAGTPELAVRGDYDPAAGTYRLRVRQRTPPTPGQPRKDPLHIPLAMGLLDPQGHELPLRLAGEGGAPVQAGTRVLELRLAEEDFVFVGLPTGLPRRPVPSLLRGFSAPVRLSDDRDDSELALLMARDPDGFARWDAAQTLMQRLLLALVAEARHPVPEGFLQAFRQALSDPRLEPALRAEVLTLPSESYLADQMETVDVDGIHRARETLRRTLGLALGAELEETWQTLVETGPYRFDPAGVGRRALRNLALAYGMAADSSGALDRCRAQWAAAHNMTDVMVALRLLVERGGPEAEEALATFHGRWSHQSLVIDKWFSLQASIARPDTLARVQALVVHPDFSLHNPNRVRSLVGTFCTVNPVCFHAPDGAGYRFLADRVLELDPQNPQVAARMLRAMTRWRRFDPARQALMQTELARVLAAPGLSRDCFEVASRSLEDSPAD